MGMLIKGYGRRFEFNNDGSTAQFWEMMLDGFEPDILIQAATHIISISNSQWPPSPGEVRNAALDFSYGELIPQTAEEAFSAVLMAIETDTTTTLPKLTKAALKAVGGSWSVKNASSQSVIQTQFTRAYEGLQRRQRVNRLALPSVKQLVETRAVRLWKDVGNER